MWRFAQVVNIAECVSPFGPRKRHHGGVLLRHSLASAVCLCWLAVESEDTKSLYQAACYSCSVTGQDMQAFAYF